MELDLKQPEIVDQVNFRESAASRFKGVWFPYFGNDFGNLVSATKPERMIKTPLLSHLCPSFASKCGRVAGTSRRCYTPAVSCPRTMRTDGD